MVYHDKLKTAADLTGVARTVFETVYGGFAFSGYFPLANKDTRTFELKQEATQAPEISSKLTGYNTTAPDGRESAGGKIVNGRVARTSEARQIDELNMVSGVSDERIGEWMEDKARILGRAIANRLRLMTAEVLNTGKVDISESNYKNVINFNRPAANSVTLTGAELWTNAASTPLADVKAWREITNGSDTIFVARSVFLALQQNTDLIKRVLRRGSDLVDDISEAEVRQVFAQEGFDIRVLENRANQVTTYAGTATTLIPQDAVFLLPPANLDPVSGEAIGEVHVAPTVESDNSEYGITGSEKPGLFAAADKTTDPEGYKVRASGEFLPLLRTPGAILRAKVA